MAVLDAPSVLLMSLVSLSAGRLVGPCWLYTAVGSLASATTGSGLLLVLKNVFQNRRCVRGVPGSSWATLAETGMLAERGMLAGGECLPASVEGECSRLRSARRMLWHARAVMWRSSAPVTGAGGLSGRTGLFERGSKYTMSMKGVAAGLARRSPLAAVAVSAS